MKDIDWPLAVALVIIFVVMSVVRWRYFTSMWRRRTEPPDERKSG